MDRTIGRMLGMAMVVCTGGAKTKAEQDGKDWTENNPNWTSQSYWQAPAILQKYAFYRATSDRKAGAASVRVDIRVSEDRPKDGSGFLALACGVLGSSVPFWQAPSHSVLTMPARKKGR